ncbi:MAG: circularly permuted type 2 ATP-grasp protein [Xanthomonadales bacterium]|nr:circularly permuted type 2 ATP-grasp protein [Xanthomonadales bacterium]
MAPLDPGEQPHRVATPGPYNAKPISNTPHLCAISAFCWSKRDLTVRGDTVYLRTLRGLKRVHVILRRQDDTHCAPLSLRGDPKRWAPAARCGTRWPRSDGQRAAGPCWVRVHDGFSTGDLRTSAGRTLADAIGGDVRWCGESPHSTTQKALRSSGHQLFNLPDPARSGGRSLSPP